MNVVTDLLGKRVKATVAPGWSHCAHSDNDSPVEGIVRAISVSETGFLLLIEDDDGTLRTRASSLTKFQLVPELFDDARIPLNSDGFNRVVEELRHLNQRLAAYEEKFGAL